MAGGSLQRPLLAPGGMTAVFFALVAVFRGPGRTRPQKEGSGALSCRLGRAGCLGEQVSSWGPAIRVLEGLRLLSGSFPQHGALASASPPTCARLRVMEGERRGGQSLKVPLATSLSYFPLPPWDGLVTELSSLPPD